MKPNGLMAHRKGGRWNPAGADKGDGHVKLIEQRRRRSYRRIVGYRRGLRRPSRKAWLRPDSGGPESGAAEVPFGTSDETGRSVQALRADLNHRAELAKVEATLREDPSITMLVNNAGTASVAPLLSANVEKMGEMVALNVTALTRLTYAPAPAFVARGTGTIINIGSVVGISPETLNGVYGATKAYVLALSHSLQHELASKGIRIQAVLPAATATELWEIAGLPYRALRRLTVARTLRTNDKQGEIHE